MGGASSLLLGVVSYHPRVTSHMDATTGLEKFYTLIYDLQFSPCGHYLAACDSYGYISIFSIVKALDPSSVGSPPKYINKWKGDGNSVYCLTSNNDYLFSGGVEGVKYWRWNVITKQQNNSDVLKPVCQVMPPHTQSSLQTTGFSDVNDLCVDEMNNVLYIACGVSVFVWDLKAESLTAVYSGHSKYIHSVCLRPGTSQFITGSEDGTVKVWNSTQELKEPIHTLKIGKKDTNWVSTVSVDSSGEWMIVGGSTSPTLYKLGSLSEIALLKVPSNVSTCVSIFTNGQIITGGSEGVVYHWMMNGESLRSVPCSFSHILSIVHNTADSQYEVLAVSGDSHLIDIFTNFGYKSFSLSVF